MEKSKEKIAGVQEKKIKIYAGISYHIFLECFKKIGILNGNKFDDQEWSIKLRNELQKKLPEYDKFVDYWLTYHNYLRDKYNIVCKIIEDGNPRRIVGYEAFRFRPLLTFLEIDDYEKLNKSFDLIPTFTPPVKVVHQNAVIPPEQPDNEPALPEEEKLSVLFTPKPYSFINILRDPDSGFICFYNNGDLVFNGQQNIYIKYGDLKTAEIHPMHGIPITLWVKIEYEKDGHLQTAYFAEIEDSNKTSELAEPEKILNRFRKQIQTNT